MREQPDLLNASEVSPVLEALLTHVGMGLWELNLVTGTLRGDMRLHRMLKLPEEEWVLLTMQRWQARVHEEDRQIFQREWRGALSGQGFDSVYRMRLGDNRWVWIHDRSLLQLPGASERAARLIGVVEDVTAVQERQQLWQGLASNLPGVIYTFRMDAHGHTSFPFISERLQEFCGIPPEAARQDAKSLFNTVHPEDLPRFMATVERSKLTLKDWHCEYRVHNGVAWHWLEGRATPEREPDGSTVWHGLVYLVDDRKRLEEELRQLSMTDELTGLFNRRHLLIRLAEALALFQRTGVPFSLVEVDLDDFKGINDQCGHAVGDYVLKQLAKLFARQLRRTDVVGRVGGEEFLILLPDTDQAGALALADALRRALAEERFTDTTGNTFHVTLSAGVTTVRPDDHEPELPWARADHALYRAKAIGRNYVMGDEATDKAGTVRSPRGH